MSTALQFREFGNPDGPAIIFLHAAGTTGWMWSEHCARLQEYRCLIPDLPGHGDNRKLDWVDARHAADLVFESLLEGRHYDEVHLVGVSLGAYVGLELLSRYQHDIGTATLSGLNILPVPDRALLRAVSTLSTPLFRLWPFARLNAKMLNIPDEKVAAYCNAARRTSLAALHKATLEALSYSPPNNLDEISVPTLSLVGENERELMHTSQRVLVKTMPNALAGVARDGGHAWCMEAPELFADALRHWVDSGTVSPGIRALHTWSRSSQAA